MLDQRLCCFQPKKQSSLCVLQISITNDKIFFIILSCLRNIFTLFYLVFKKITILKIFNQDLENGIYVQLHLVVEIQEQVSLQLSEQVGQRKHLEQNQGCIYCRICISANHSLLFHPPEKKDYVSSRGIVYPAVLPKKHHFYHRNIILVLKANSQALLI